MTVTALMKRLKAADIVVTADGGELVLTTRSDLPADLVAEVRVRKNELLSDACAECGLVDLAVYDETGRALCSKHGLVRCSICGRPSALASVTACMPCVADGVASRVR